MIRIIHSLVFFLISVNYNNGLTIPMKFSRTEDGTTLSICFTETPGDPVSEGDIVAFDDLIQLIAQPENVTSIYIFHSNENSTAWFWEQLPQFSSLSWISFESSNLGDLKRLSQKPLTLNKLRTIHISRNNIKDTDAPELAKIFAQFPNLVEIHCRENAINNHSTFSQIIRAADPAKTIQIYL